MAAIAVAMMLLCATPATAATGWTITPSPNPIAGHPTYLDSVSCTGPTTAIRCFAVGSYISAQSTVKTLIERWNGSQWTIVASPNRAGIANSLVGVKCASATSCFAVGNSQATPTSPAVTLIERWNGLTWTIVPSPNPVNAKGSFLHAVSCVGPNRCFAVGNYKSDATAGSTLIERWTGTSWVIAPSPNKPGAATNDLEGVSCVPAGTGVSCFAVGSYATTTSSSIFYTLTERWTGAGWFVVPSPNVGGQYKSGLNAVSCTSPTFCIAVGVWHHSPGASLSERWNGTAWTIVNVSNWPGWTFSQLHSVSCLSPSDCIAVGGWASGTPVKTFVSHYNGAAWVPFSSPSPTGSRGSSLAGVACVGAKCTAVGSAQKPTSYAAATLTERNY